MSDVKNDSCLGDPYHIWVVTESRSIWPNRIQGVLDALQGLHAAAVLRVVDVLRHQETIGEEALDVLQQLVQEWAWSKKDDADFQAYPKTLRNTFDLLRLRDQMAVAFGDDLTEKVSKTDGANMIASAISLTDELEIAGDLASGKATYLPMSTFLVNAVKDKFIIPLKTAVLKHAWDELHTAVVSTDFHATAGGKSDGTLWYNEIEDPDDIEQTIAAAQETILKIKPVERKRITDNVRQKLESYEHALKFYHIDEDPNESKLVQVKASLRQAAAVHYSGILAWVYVKHRTDATKMKRTCAEPQKAIEKQKLQELMPRSLYTMAKKASSFARV